MDLHLIKSTYLNNQFKENGYGWHTYGLIGNVGYWHIYAIGQNMLEIDEILDYFANADGLIVDMRHNNGGNFTYAFSNLADLPIRNVLYTSPKPKIGKAPMTTPTGMMWSIYPSGEYFNKPIVLITDRYTISAGERTVMAFKTLPNVTHIGDTTNGSIATKISKELANGWYYSLVTQKTLFHNGISYEGSGIPPNEYFKNTSAEMANGQDITLEEAISKF